MPMTHIPEIVAENRHQKTGTINWHRHTALSYSLLETGTWKNQYQIAKIFGQVHCLHSLLPPATNYSARHRPKGHPFDLPRYIYDRSHKSFVSRCLYKFK